MIDRLTSIKNAIKEKKPLIHCITNPISINDCANAVLAMGARPIMAEHPKEVAEITRSAQALAVNLGNITDARLESMLIAGKEARRIGIPVVMDLVGVSCSSLRLDFAKTFATQVRPQVIKGNMSEIKTMAGAAAHAVGVDVGITDVATEVNLRDHAALAKKISEKYHTVVVATGKIDLVVTLDQVIRIDNGVEMLAELTGTGCMLTVLTAACMSCGEPAEASVLASVLMGIAGEKAYTPQGTGSFHVRLLDSLYRISPEELKGLAQIQQL